MPRTSSLLTFVIALFVVGLLVAMIVFDNTSPILVIALIGVVVLWAVGQAVLMTVTAFLERVPKRRPRRES